MANLKPWYKVVTPREDLREGKPLDASEFAVHLDHVRDGRAHIDYQKPDRFFERTFLTKNLMGLAAQVVRRLSGEKTETSAIFNMTTQFGGGKTHALTLLYHLANNGPKAKNYRGVDRILEQSGMKDVPKAPVAVFVGTDFDSIHGRGGKDGTPNRKTPWGEIAFQLSGETGFSVVEEHEKQKVAPSGEVIREFLPKNKPALILVDELLNYISRNRKSGLSTQLYNFIQNLAEEARGNDRVVLVASIPASELEMTAEDQADYSRFKKLLDRVGKAVIMAAESETSEIIRRRLFEWDSRAVSQSGHVLLPKDALAACKEYADWIKEHKQQIPSWFQDNAKESFETTYPFHPMVLSVFERKWQELPRFQQTRGVLRLLALWVSHAYQQGFKGAQKDALISLGSAPLEDSQFRSAVLEQLGESRLEGALTTDIAGKKDSHAVRLDQEAEETLKKARIHRKVATVIFFESNGGQTKNAATVPEIRLGVAEPELDIGNTETALDALTDACYYLGVERNQYRFSLKENLNKRFSDRRAGIKDKDVDKLVLEEIQKVFPATEGVERIFFPKKSNQVPDRPVITFIVLGPEQSIQDDPEIEKKMESMTKECGTSARTYKSALIWLVPDLAATMLEESRKLLAWEDIESEGLKLDDAQEKQLLENIKKAKRDLRESIWRTYNKVVLLGRDNTMRTLDLGLVTSSAAETMCKLVLNHLRQTDDIVKDVSPRSLVKNWPPAFTEWSTRAVRDAFYASPQFPRLLTHEAIQESVVRGVAEGVFAYVGKSPKGGYSPFYFKKQLRSEEVETSEDMYLIKAEEAEKHIKPPELARILVSPSQGHLQPSKKQTFTAKGLDQFGRDFDLKDLEWSTTGGQIETDGVFKAGVDEGNFLVVARCGKINGEAAVSISKDIDVGPTPPPPGKAKKLIWSGEIPPQKWTTFYTKVLTRFASGEGLRISLNIEVAPKDGVSEQKIEETKVALRDLGLKDDVKTS
ncbi:MAG: ATP-binding protein [Desulfobacteraceae bacterium]|nr:MAG: ATP-binding protein [Desulfobacteraceae bacterium]